MRQRTIKDIDKRINENSSFLIKDPEALKGKWEEEFGNANPIHIEIGSGKGKFITSLATLNKDINYISFEGQDDVGLRILEKTEELNLPNIRVAISYVNDLGMFFNEKELSGIYLSFSDPWPKKRHAKRRLTFHKRIENYLAYLDDTGFIEFRTDNEELFNFSLEELELLNIKPKIVDRDFKAELTTEYEDKFRALGKKINFYRIEKEVLNED